MAIRVLSSDPPVPVAVPTAELGEGAHWDADSGALYWVDAPAGLVYRLDTDGNLNHWDAGQPVGAVVHRAGGGLVLTAATGSWCWTPAPVR